MPKLSQGTLTLAGLAAFAIWLFGVLPFLYGPPPRFAETSSPPQAHSSDAAQNSDAKPDGSQNAPFFIKIPKTAEERAQDAEDRKEKSATDWWLMIFTGAVALFTLLLVGATVLLYRAGERQLAHLEETSQRQLRAYIVDERARITDVEVGKSPKVEVRIRNTGQTPAYGLTAALGIGYLPTIIIKGQFPKLPEVSARASRVTLGRDQFLNHEAIMEDVISTSEMLAIKSGAGALYVVGAVKYTDAFRLPRTTNFRLIYNAGDGQLSICEEGNESD